MNLSVPCEGDVRVGMHLVCYLGRYSRANCNRASMTSCFGKKEGWGRGSGIGIDFFEMVNFVSIGIVVT